MSFWATPSNNIITSNVVYDNGTDGILTNGSNNLFSFNLFYDSAGTDRPINIGSNIGTNNYLVGNLITSWPASYATILDNGTTTKYTGKEKITLEPSNICSGLSEGGTLTPAGPVTFLQLTPTVNISGISIADGKAIGDILILENTSASFSVAVSNFANTRLLYGADRTLRQYDTLSLIWNGNDWYETGYSNNVP